MSYPFIKDKTCDHLYVTSTEPASNESAAGIIDGGLKVKKNILCENINCEDALIYGDLEVNGNFKNNLLYESDSENIYYKKNILPHYADRTIGQKERPWSHMYTLYHQSKQQKTDTLKANQISTKTLTADKLNITQAETQTINTQTINTQTINAGELKNDTLSFGKGYICASGDLSLINTNGTLMFRSSGEEMEFCCPNYQTWNNFKCDTIIYERNLIITVYKSVMVIYIEDNTRIDLGLCIDNVPVNTKLKLYFIDQKIMSSAKVVGRLRIYHRGKTNYLSFSDSKKTIKLVLIDSHCIML